MTTLQEAAQAALDVQSACNLSGVVNSFAEVTKILWEEARRTGKGTDWVNTHPICWMFSTQIVHLSNRHVKSAVELFHVYNEVEQIAKGEG